MYHAGIQYVAPILARALNLHSKISTASFVLGGVGYLGYQGWNKLTQRRGIDSNKTQSFALTAFFRLVESNLLNPSMCDLHYFADRKSIKKSVGTDISSFKPNKRHDYLVLRLVRITARFAALTTISTVIAPLGVGWNGGQLINHWLFSGKGLRCFDTTAFGQDLLIASLIPSYSFTAAIMIQTGLTRLAKTSATFFCRLRLERMAQVCIYAGVILAELINQLLSRTSTPVLIAGLSLIYSSSINIKNYICALSPSLSTNDLQGLLKSICMRQYLGCVGLRGNLLISHHTEDREKFEIKENTGLTRFFVEGIVTRASGHCSDLMYEVAGELLTKLELIQQRLPPVHKLTLKHLESKNNLIRHLNTVPNLKNTQASATALCLAQDALPVRTEDVNEVDLLWSALEGLESLFKNVIEIERNASDLSLRTLGLQSIGHTWKTVRVPPFYLLKSEYADRFFAILDLTSDEKKTSWQAYLQNCVILSTTSNLSGYSQFSAVKKRVRQSTTPWECLGLSEENANEAQINQAYRRSQLWVHPDKLNVFYPETERQAAEELTRALNQAKELCLPKKRQRGPS